MKVRNGFVSNSSSSSFILQLEKAAEEYSYEELCDYFGYVDPIKQIQKALLEGENLGGNRYEIEVGSDCGSSVAEDYLYSDLDTLYPRNGIIIDSKSFH